ncbi:MAG: DNRLRE domain-containing protein, partial [Oscillospiraceae bacterium]|nr:DNRLRE domain-containing protein [Oscillospiraceae bacterium]
MTDGSNMAVVYPAAVHFEENGDWAEIDNQLELRDDAEGGQVYVNRRNSFGVSLPAALDKESWFGVSTGGHSLFFRLLGVQESEAAVAEEPKPSEDPLERAVSVHYDSAVLYTDALPGSELRYDLGGQSLKETICFSALEFVPEELSYEIRAEGLQAEWGKDGEILFLAEDEAVFRLPAPFLEDCGGESLGAVAVELKELGEGRFLLRYTPERDWLEAEERCWPVTLDPVFSNESATNYYRDSFVCHAFPYTNFGTDRYLNVGSTGAQEGGQNTQRRALIKHEQFPTLESGDVIVKAELTAYGYMFGANTNQILVEAHAITTGWNSLGVNWFSQPLFEDEVLDFQIVDSTTETTYTWDVTGAVQRWYNGAASIKGSLANEGFMLKSPLESDPSPVQAKFRSSDKNDFLYWPKLFLYYRNTTGLESYWDYTGAGAGRAGTVSANNFTGNLVVSRSDMGYSGNRMPANIAFVYNQNDCAADIGYGKGWRSAYSQRIEYAQHMGVSLYKWTDGDGTRIYFIYDDTAGEWVDEAGLGYRLSVNAAGYTITDRDDNSLGFDAKGRLVSMTDKLSNTLGITYTESGTANLRISRITDGVGRVYDFSYSNNLLSAVVYKGAGSTAIETVSYSYDSGALTTVTYADGKAAGYVYDSGKLTEARDILRGDGSRNRISVSYEGSPAKVTELSYSDGATLVNSVSLRYGDHITFVTDNLDRWCAYEFNSMGNTVSVYNQKGQALYGTFANNDGSSGRANQLTHSSRLQDTVVNLLDTRERTGAWSETVMVQSGMPYSLSGVTGGGATLSMSAGSETRTAASVSGTARTEVTLTIPAGVTSLTISGSAGASELQLEQTEAASRYNMLSNTDMSSASGWTGTNLGNSDGILTLADTWDNLKVPLSESVLKLVGVGSQPKSYTQTVSVSGSAGDDYSFGGWVKSESVPLSNKNGPSSTLERHCGIRVRLLNGSTEVDSKTVDANTACPEWQFLSGSLRASGAYDTVEFSFIYEYNANVSYFDGAQLFREKFAYVYHYDGEGRVDKITDLEGRETSYTYRGTSSDITSITLPGGAEYTYSYSNSGLLQSAVSDTGVTSAYTYDAYGNPTGTTITGGNEKSLTSGMTYTSDGNMTASVTGNDADTVSYTNDTDRSLVTSVTDPANVVTSNTYDTMRRPVTSQTGSSAITNSYSDDLLVGLSHTNTANTSTDYTLEYTTAELLASVQVGSSYTLVENSYNPGTWTLAAQDFGNGAGWAYAYSEFDDLTARWTTNGTSGVEFRYFYNSEGALARVEQYDTILADEEITARTLVNTERYYYDTTDRLIRVWETDADGNQHEFRWTYDSNDQVVELVETVNGHTFTYTNSYNGDQQPTQSSYGDIQKGFSYDGLGRLSQSTVSSSNSPVLTTNYSYRDLDATRTTTQVSALQNSYGNQNENLTYTYNVRGNISSVSDGTHTTLYEYDALNELVWEKNAEEEKAWHYSYDLGGNILSKEEYGYQNGVVSSTPLSTVNYTYGDANWPDLMTAYDGSPISYDGMGNPTSYRGWSFTWQGGRQLKSASEGTTSLSFVYNESGLRTEKTVGSTSRRYVYRGSALVAEITDDYELYFHHDANGGIVGFTYVSGNTQAEYFYRKNLQGDVIGIVDSTGASVAEYRYDAWGQITSATGTMASVNPIRYRGYYYDAETGLYYLHSRYYDPEIGRFINADAFASTGQGILGVNMFAYCGNEPVDGTDPDGLFV